MHVDGRGIGQVHLHRPRILEADAAGHDDIAPRRQAREFKRPIVLQDRFQFGMVGDLNEDLVECVARFAVGAGQRDDAADPPVMARAAPAIISRRRQLDHEPLVGLAGQDAHALRPRLEAGHRRAQLVAVGRQVPQQETAVGVAGGPVGGILQRDGAGGPVDRLAGHLVAGHHVAGDGAQSGPGRLGGGRLGLQDQWIERNRPPRVGRRHLHRTELRPMKAGGAGLQLIQPLADGTQLKAAGGIGHRDQTGAGDEDLNAT
ncbi:MAG: hypothetical protein BWZ08_02455 [candidate division BRC1 bacterium ADurb.BinA292]|nr:MAG: hypothetical protein BWZ08_02455 [candidate division BRC1 bacterium ADurb.BinA292]